MSLLSEIFVKYSHLVAFFLFLNVLQDFVISMTTCQMCFRLEFEDVPINSLARESRLVLQLFGKILATADSDESKNSNEPVYKEDEIGWTAIQFFNYEG